MKTDADQNAQPSDAPETEAQSQDAAQADHPAQQVTDIEGDPTADLRAQLAEKDAQLGEYVDRLKRGQADFENYKKRKEKEQAEVFTLNEDRLLGEFLPLYDGLRRAFEVYQKDQNQSAFIEGVELIFAKLNDFLDAKQIQAIEAVGQKFDPALHEVLLSVEADGQPHRVLEEFECGYTRQGRLLRPSRVTVSKPKADTVPEAETANDDQPQNSEAKE